MARFDSNGWLVPGSSEVPVELHSTPKTTPYAKVVGGKPLGLVWHWTAGAYREDDGLTQWAISSSLDPSYKASWHFYISKKGVIYQFAPIYVGTWTTGSGGTLFDRVKGIPTQVPFPNVNVATIGVELENSGILLKQNGEWYAWPYANVLRGKSENDAREAARTGTIPFERQFRVRPARAIPWTDGEVYDAWTPAQQKAAEVLVRAVSDALGWTDPERVNYGHRTFYVKRDPGLLWMEDVLPGIQRRVYGRAAGESLARAASYANPIILGALAGVGLYWLLRRRKA